MTARILAAAHRQERRAWVYRFSAAGGAVAAAAVLALLLLTGRPAAGPGPSTDDVATQAPAAESIVDRLLPDVAREDRDLVANLNLFRNYDEIEVSTVADAETLKALADLEATEGL